MSQVSLEHTWLLFCFLLSAEKQTLRRLYMELRSLARCVFKNVTLHGSETRRCYMVLIMSLGAGRL